MEEIKIIEGEKESYEKQYIDGIKKGFQCLIETHRMVEFGGKIIYSAVMIKVGDKT